MNATEELWLRSHLFKIWCTTAFRKIRNVITSNNSTIILIYKKKLFLLFQLNRLFISNILIQMSMRTNDNLYEVFVFYLVFKYQNVQLIWTSGVCITVTYRIYSNEDISKAFWSQAYLTHIKWPSYSFTLWYF